jgi:hypothetical protein
VESADSCRPRRDLEEFSVRVIQAVLGPGTWEAALFFNRKYGLEALQTLLRVLTSTPSTKIQSLALGCKDPVFVSIDIEGQGHGGIRELGISIFDTQILQNSTISDPCSAISTYNYTTQQNIVTKKREFDKELRIFRYGQTQYIEERWLGWLVCKILQNGSPDPACTEIRNKILVGHCVGGDLAQLTTIRGGKVKFLLRNFPNVLVFDTQIIAQRWFGANRKLKDIMRGLRMRFKGNDLHCAGNDAHFTLRVLLMLAIYEDIKTGELQPRSKLLETIARPKCEDRLPKHLEYMFIGDYPEPLIKDFQVPAQENMEEEED